MTTEQTLSISLSMKFRASRRLPRHHADGSTTYFDMEVIEPVEYAGQVRDLTIHADRSVTLGADRARTAKRFIPMTNHYTFGRDRPYIEAVGETLLSCCGHEDLDHWITEDEQGCEKCACQDRGPWLVRSPEAKQPQQSGACQHPSEFRRPIPDHHSDDPNEWECVLCGTYQMKGAPERV